MAAESLIPRAAMSMASADPAGAAPSAQEEWLAIDWQAVHLNVRRLQVRIVKATQEGRWGRVKALQRLLTHSYSAKVLAVKRVTENQGKKTPGVDKITWNTPRQKMLSALSLRRRNYHPQPLRRIYIPKKNGKMRPLGIPTMKDRAMQALHLLALEPVAETLADPRSYGFRPERSCADAIQQCFIALSKSYSAQWVLEGDIKACFDRISHDWLLRHIPTDTAVLKKWLKAGYMEKQKVYPTDEGTPQGGIISPVLANLALDGLQKLLKGIPWQLKEGRSPQLNLVRYADDFITTGRSKELLAERAVPLVESFTRERGLELSLEKTSITHISEGFDFLGQTIRKYNGKLLTKPSKKSVKVFLEKVRGIIRDNRAAMAAKMIEELNPVIKGWANYHQHVCSKATYGKVDHSIFQCLWQWAKRRHPTKPHRWIVSKYFGNRGGDRWSFYGTVGKGEDRRTLHLYKANATRIRRHVQIRGAANPYDPEWETYFEERDGLKLAATTVGRRKLSYLWRNQQGICPVCQKRITGASGWNLHHMVWRTRGGSDGAENRVLLHDYCHTKAHAQKLTVVKPRSSRGVRDA